MSWILKVWDRIRNPRYQSVSDPKNASGQSVSSPGRPKKRPERRIRVISASRSIKTAEPIIKTHSRGVQRVLSATERPNYDKTRKPDIQTRILQRLQRAPATARQVGKSLRIKQSRIGHHLQMLIRDKRIHRQNRGEYIYHAGPARR